MFFVAGTETTSTVLDFALYELSSNTRIQDKLRSEITRNTAEKGFTPDSIKAMKYLEMCIQGNESIS